MSWYAGIGAVCGASVPILLLLIHSLVNRIGVELPTLSEGLTLCLWPSSLFLIGASDRGWTDPVSLQLLALSLSANVILYSAIACTIWFGLHRHASLLVALAVLVIIGWIGLLRL